MNARHWIAGEWTGTPDIDSIDPATGEAIGRFADGGSSEADAATAAARRAFDRTTWAQDARLRQDVLLGWASALEAERDTLATLLTRQNGKAIAQSRGEIAGAISEVRYYAGLARHIAGHVLEPEPGTISTMLREAAGVAAIIVPWNAPAVLLVRSLAPALAAGCTAIVKPAAQTSLLTAAMLRCFEHTALPEGAVNLVNERGYAASQRLVDSHGVDVVSFTGSTATGKKIMAAAADSMKKLSLELGGKSCCVVFDDADVAAIAPRLARRDDHLRAAMHGGAPGAGSRVARCANARAPRVGACVAAGRTGHRSGNGYRRAHRRYDTRCGGTDDRARVRNGQARAAARHLLGARVSVADARRAR